MGLLPPVVQRLQVSARDAIQEWRDYGTETGRALARAAATAEAEATRMEATSRRAAINAQRAAERASLATGQTAARAQLAAQHAAADAAEAAEAATQARARADAATAEAGAAADRTRGSFDRLKETANTAMVGVGIAMAAVGAKSLQLAANFETATRQLVTGAGESADALGLVRKGLLDMAGEVGKTPEELAKGMFAVESSGYRAADGLNVLRAAAQGATANGAELETTVDALTTIMVNYGMKAGDATNAMNQLTAAAAASKVDVQDLAASMSAVLPVAAASKLSFVQVGAALATMTNSGMSAQQASQNLAFTIRALQAPNLQAQKQFSRLGLSANDVAKNLGSRGLTGTLEMLTRAIASHTKGGDVLIDTFNQSKSAVAAMETMMKSMPAEVRDLAAAYADGSMTISQYSKAVGQLPANQAVLAQQFATLFKRANGFNDFLKQGGPAAQTYTAALAKMAGGATGLNTSLMLTGSNTAAFNSAVAVVQKAADGGNEAVTGWAMAQKDFSIQLAKAKGSLQAVGITIGNVLIPPLSAALGFFQEHETTTKVLGVALVSLVGSLALVGAGLKVISMVQGLMEVVTAIRAFGVAAKIVAVATKVWAGVQWLLNAAMAANPIGLVVIAIAALVAGAIYAYTHFEGFRNAVNAVGSALKTGFLAAVRGAVVAWEWLKTAFSATVDWFQQLPGRIMAGLRALPGLLWNFVKTTALQAAYLLGYGFGVMVREAIALPGRISAGVSALRGWVVKFFTNLWNSAVRITTAGARSLVQWAGRTVDGVVSWFQQLPGRATAFVSQLWTRTVRTGATIASSSVAWARSTINGVVSWFQRLPGQAGAYVAQLPGRIRAAASNAGTWLLDAGRRVVQGLINGIRAAMGAAMGAVRALGGSLVSGFKSAMGISSPSKVFASLGKWIPPGIAQGIESTMGVVQDALDGTPTTIGAGGFGGGGGRFAVGRASQPGVRSARATDVVQVPVTVLLDGQVLFRSLQTVALRHQGRNGTNGLQLA